MVIRGQSEWPLSAYKYDFMEDEYWKIDAAGFNHILSPV